MHRINDREDDVARARLAQQAVAFAFGEALEEIAAPTRASRRAAAARQTAMYLAHVSFGMSLARVAYAFGRDRSTVAHACRVTEDRREDRGFDDDLEKIEEFLRAAPAEVRHDHKRAA
ncbi:MAG: helix-turn-helix domain-containing protein [Maricaulaceae bacterium]|jgi:chromosomal replication initiation ATPase DnaA